MSTSLVRWNDKAGKSIPRVDVYTYSITSAVATPLVAGYPALVSFGALTQATIDSYLGTSSDVNYLNFDATSLGTDAIGFIFDMAGQCKQLVSVGIVMRSGTGFVTTVERYATPNDVMVNTQLAVAEAALSTLGNPYARFVVTSIDSTTGYIDVTVKWISK